MVAAKQNTPLGHFYSIFVDNDNIYHSDLLK